MATKVANRLGLRHVSAGDFMREMAAERGMSILELSRSAEQRDVIDREIDARTARMAEQSSNFVMDARLGWHFAPQSVKVFLEVSPQVAARRIYDAQRGSEHENVSIDQTRAAIESRTESERKRYFNYYDLDYTDHSHYDLVVDTSEKSIDEVVDTILDHVTDDQ